MKKVYLALITLLFTGCLFNAENRAEMQQTGEVPVAIKNETKADMSIYCDFPPSSILQSLFLRVARLIDPNHKSTCEQLEAEQ
jgi:hypothetical protein